MFSVATQTPRTPHHMHGDGEIDEVFVQNTNRTERDSGYIKLARRGADIYDKGENHA